MKELLKRYNLTQSKFAREFEIPLRTVQNWCNGERTPPPYLIKLIEFKLQHR